MRLGEEGEPEAAEAIGFYAELIGWLHRKLMLGYRPPAPESIVPMDQRLTMHK